MEFVLDPDAFWGRCGPVYVATIRPVDLVNLFGYPINDGDSESLGSYIFKGPAGEVAIIYFRAYDLSSLLLRIFRKRFWRGKDAIELTVAAENPGDARLFCEWLATRIEMRYRPW